MAIPDHDKPAPSPLDTDRARLRSQGYSEVEISQILTARASGVPQQPTAAGGQGVLSNVLGSLMAVWAHVRTALPSVRKDVATIFDGAAPTPARAGASASLAVKIVVIAVLGYAAWQEWGQHIISTPAMVEAQAEKAKAEACSARSKAIIDTVPMGQKTRDAFKKLEAECSPAYKVTAGSPDTDAAKRDAAPLFPLRGQPRLKEKFENAAKAGDYAEAFKLAQQYEAGIEAEESTDDFGVGVLTSAALSRVAWQGLFAREFPRALEASERSIKLSPGYPEREINRAHALLFLGRTAEARTIYLSHKGEDVHGSNWGQMISDNFGQLRKAGITHSLMDEIEAALK
jgi:hypothetical protein